MTAAAFIVLSTSACGAPRAAVHTEAPAEESADAASLADLRPRKPDGVVVEPPTARPSAVTSAEARGIVALRPSLSSDAVRECAQELLDAWQQGSLDGLAGLLTPDAGPLEARGRGPSVLIETFRQRLRAHDYKRLEGVDLARLDRILHYSWSDLGGDGAPARPAEMRPDETYVRIPLETTQIAGERFFDATIVLILRDDQGRARITAYGEAP